MCSTRYNAGMLRIECTGLTLREGKELEERVRQVPGVGGIELDLNIKGVPQTRSVQAAIPHFYLFIRAAAVGFGGGVALVAGKTVTQELTKDIYKALKQWMTRFSDKSVVEVEVKLYGPDNRLIGNSKKTR